MNNPMNMTVTRRQALAGGLRLLGSAALGMASPRLLAQGSGAQGEFKPLTDTNPNAFVFSRVQYQSTMEVKDNWDIHPVCDESMLAYVRKVTNIEMSTLPWAQRVVSIDDAERIETLPFLFMTGEGTFELTQAQAGTFGEFFKRGGFLYGDDCVIDRRSDYFFKCMQREFVRALPGMRFRDVPSNHAIYKCFYDFNGRAPHCSGTPQPDRGLFYKDRLVCFVTAGDVHCGWSPDHYYGAAKTEECYRFGVNLIVYALTH